tara:strand:+ start:23119 stop:23871 length:753 start_codon:yes stop_codon:yes gene_type:complete
MTDRVQASNVGGAQFISFVEGSSSSAPDISAFALHVLGADHNLNNINGGNPSEGFDPWVTDILVYPSSEYWETQLSGDRIRPFVDLSISEYNTLRIPSAVHNYDLYADKGRFYEDVTIEGTLTVGGIGFATTGVKTIDATDVNATNISGDNISGVAKTKIPVEEVTADFTFDVTKTGFLYQCKPSGAKISITLPASAEVGVNFTVNNCLEGKTVDFTNLANARGTVLGEQFSSATIYFDGSAWYGIGDFV